MERGGDEDWISFHQQEDLTTRLHNILEEYPPGIGIFKEFLQNADDAGARKFALVFDQRQHSADASRLFSPAMGSWQGPALCVYNDALFTDGDFESISHVGRSGKHDDVAKIGKYGLGFNCAYHFTDVVSFVTADQLVVFDPHGTSLPGGRMGLRCNFIKRQLVEVRKDQIKPFLGWDEGPFVPWKDFNGRGPLDGTLFRLPLRSIDQAEKSAIAKNVFDEEEVVQMLVEFSEAAGSMLLFLKNVEEISIFIRRPDRPVQVLARVTASSGNGMGLEALRECRQCSITSNPPRLLRCSYPLRIQTERPHLPTSEQQWLLHWRWSGTDKNGDQAPSVAAGLGLNLWVAIAAPLPDAPSPNTLQDDLDEWEGDSGKEGGGSRGGVGRAYCYLPLPIATGLHVHIHAAFALSSSRRDLCQASDAGGAGALKAVWNEHLMSSAIPLCYVELLHRFPAHLDTCGSESESNENKRPTVSLASAKALYRLLPNLEQEGDDAGLAQIKAPFETLGANTLLKAAESECRFLWQPCSKSFVALEQATFEDIKFQQLCNDCPGMRAVLVGGANGRRDADGIGLRLVSSPRWLHRSLAKAGAVGVAVTSPNLVAEMLRQSKKKLSSELACHLLRYLLSDWKFSHKSSIRRLQGLKILPLLDSKLGTVQARTGCSQVFFIPPSTMDSSGKPINYRELMPTFPNFLDEAAIVGGGSEEEVCEDGDNHHGRMTGLEVWEVLNSPQFQTQCNIAFFDLRTLANNMEFVLPGAWKGCEEPIVLCDQSSTSALASECVDRVAGGLQSDAESTDQGARIGKRIDERRKKGRHKDERASDGESDSDVVVVMEEGSDEREGKGVKKRGKGGKSGQSGAAKESKPVQATSRASKLECGSAKITEIEHRLALFWRFVEASRERIDIRRVFRDWPIVTARSADGSCTMAMSVGVAESNFLLVKDLYSEAECQVLRAFDCLFVSEAPARLLESIFSKKGPQALRAVARHAKRTGRKPSYADSESLRALVLKWIGLRDFSYTAALSAPAACDVAGSVLHALPVFETLEGTWVDLASTRIASTRSKATISPPAAWESLLREGGFKVPCLITEGDAGLMLGAAHIERSSEEEFLGECLGPWLESRSQTAQDNPVATGLYVEFLEAVERCNRSNPIWKRRQDRWCRSIISALMSARLVKCIDGQVRRISDCWDPEDRDLSAVSKPAPAPTDSTTKRYSSIEALQPVDAYRSTLHVLRQAGMVSLTDGKCFVRAAREVADAQQTDSFSRPSDEKLQAGRRLLSFLVTRHKELHWSNAEWDEIAYVQWVPAQDWSRLNFPPDSTLSLLRTAPVEAPTLEDDAEGAQADEGFSSSEDEESEDPACLPPAALRDRVREIYKAKAPAREAELTKLFAKNKSREVAMYNATLAKFGIDGTSFFKTRSPDKPDGKAQKDSLEAANSPAKNLVDLFGGSSRQGGGPSSEEDESWRLVSFASGCCLRKDAAAAWTQRRVLDGIADRLPHTLARRLGVPHPPEPRVLCDHINAFIERVKPILNALPPTTRPVDVAHEEQGGDAEAGRDDVMRAMAVLQRCALELAKAVKRDARSTKNQVQLALQDTPLVLTHVDSAAPKLVKPRTLCFDLELRPDSLASLQQVAVPDYLQTARPLLMLLGAQSALSQPAAAGKAITIKVSSPNPGAGGALLTVIQSQFNQAVVSDAHFVPADGSTPIYTHRLVLMTASPYFTNLFTGEMQGGMQQLPVIVPLPEWCEREAALLALGHMYRPNGDIDAARLCKSEPESVGIVLNLLRLSDLWMMDWVKQWCEEWLASSAILDIWNVCTLLTHAFACKAPQIQELCIRHIQRMFSFVSKTHEWADLSEELQDLVLGRLGPGGDSESEDDDS